MWRLRHCFADDQQVMIQEGRMLLDYVTMNAIAISKILKKYDKVSCRGPFNLEMFTCVNPAKLSVYLLLKHRKRAENMMICMLFY